MVKKRLLLVGSLVLAVIFFLNGCTNGAWDDLGRNPPDRGLLHELRTSGMKNPTSNGYVVEVSTSDGEIVSGQSETLLLAVKDEAGKPVNRFTEDMTKLFHFIIVSRDLSIFAHIHPEFNENGTFEIQHQFPFAGDFLLISEFIPAGKELTVHKQWITLPGTSRANSSVSPDSSSTKTIDDVVVTLSTMPDSDELKAGQMVMLNFQLTDKNSGKPIADVEPFLGTRGHAVILDSSADRYLHVHAMDGMGGGSNVMFHTEFPAAGLYKIWGQFQVNGKVIVAPFVLQVK